MRPYSFLASFLMVSLYTLNKMLKFESTILEVDFNLSDFPGLEGFSVEAKPVEIHSQYKFSQQASASLVHFSRRAPEILFTALLMEKKPSNMAYLAVEQLIQSWAQVALASADWQPRHCQAYGSQLLALGLQIGLDFTTESGGLLVAAYVSGQAFEALASMLFDKFEKSGHFAKHQQKYPAFLLNKALWQQAAYVVGAFLGQSLFNNMRGFLLKTSTTRPLQLNDHEASLLENDRNCRVEHRDCLKTARKVLRLNPAENHNAATIKQAYRQLTLFWHPDKNKGYDSETIQREITQLNNAFKILK